MEDGTSKKPKLILVALILVLVVILTVGVVFVVKSFGGGKEEEREISQVDCMKEDGAEKISECIKKEYRESGDRDELFLSYEKASAAAREEKNYDAATILIVARSEFLAVIRDCTSALQLFENEDLSEFGTRNRAKVYDSAVGISVECGDKSEEIKWNNRISEAMSQMEGTYYYEYSD